MIIIDSCNPFFNNPHLMNEDSFYSNNVTEVLSIQLKSERRN